MPLTASNCWWLPISRTWPLCITMILSARWMVLRRWAMMSEVRPSTRRVRASRTRNSVSVSTLEVASSRMSTRGLWARARAKLTSCFCPVERVLPRSCKRLSKPSGSAWMKSEALTSSAACSRAWRVTCSEPRRMLSAIVPLKRNGSCNTTPQRRRSSCRFISRTSTPSSRTAPFCTS